MTQLIRYTIYDVLKYVSDMILVHDNVSVQYCSELGKGRPRHWGKAGLGDRLDRLLKEQTQSGDGI